MTDYAAELCRRWKAKNSAAYLLTGSEDHFIEPRCLQYRMKQYTKACGLENVHFHTLRHTFATRCVEVDFEIKSLSEILGHPSPTVTLERYVHSSMEKYLAVIAQNSEKGIYLDGSTLVGKLAPGMNRQLGILAAQEVYR